MLSLLSTFLGGDAPPASAAPAHASLPISTAPGLTAASSSSSGARLNLMNLSTKTRTRAVDGDDDERGERVGVVVAGLDNAGKTTLVKKLQTGLTLEFPPTDASRGDVVEVDGLGVFRLWELAREDADAPLARVRNAVGFVFVVDATDRASLPRARDELHRVLAMVAHKASRNMRKGKRRAPVLPVAVLLNKCDLVRQFIPPHQVLTALDIPPDSINVQAFVGTSTDGLGAVEALAWLQRYYVAVGSSSPTSSSDVHRDD